jgi:uncharacterized protein YceK
MRWLILFASLGLLAGCSSVSEYDATGSESHTSNVGSEAGEGVQTSIWSNDPSKKTLTNQSGQTASP